MHGDVRGLMCSYNAVRGVPACASKLLVDATQLWGFKGYTSSDSDAVHDAFSAHHYYSTEAEAACGSIEDGRCDINSGNTYQKALLQGVANNSCTMQNVDDALRRTLTVRFQLGLFDPKESNAYNKIGIESQYPFGLLSLPYV